MRSLVVAGTAMLFCLAAAEGRAQSNTSGAAMDWSGNYAFGGATAEALRLQRADLIEKKDNGFYDRVGETSYEIHNDNSTNIEQQSNSTGSVNNSQTNVDFGSSGGNSFSGSNGAYNWGCQDGSIDISSPSGSSDGAACN